MQGRMSDEDNASRWSCKARGVVSLAAAVAVAPHDLFGASGASRRNRYRKNTQKQAERVGTAKCNRSVRVDLGNAVKPRLVWPIDDWARFYRTVPAATGSERCVLRGRRAPDVHGQYIGTNAHSRCVPHPWSRRRFCWPSRPGVKVYESESEWVDVSRPLQRC